MGKTSLPRVLAIVLLVIGGATGFVLFVGGLAAKNDDGVSRLTIVVVGIGIMSIVAVIGANFRKIAQELNEWITNEFSET